MPKRIVLFALVYAALLATAAGSSAGFHYTHSVTVRGTLVDHWSVTDPAACAPNGTGSVSITFKTVKATKEDVKIDAFEDAQTTNVMGNWALDTPQGFGIWAPVGREPVSGTVTLLDNTTPRPSPDVDCGAPTVIPGCGTRPLVHDHEYVAGYNRRYLSGEMDAMLSATVGSCGVGSLESFTDPAAVVGGDRQGQILIKMPNAARLSSRKPLTVSTTVHHKVTTDVGDGRIYTVDVSRTITVTFTPVR